MCATDKTVKTCSESATECFADLQAKICLWWFNFKLIPIFATAPAATKNEAHFKCGQNVLGNNHLATEDLNSWNSL